MEYQLKASLLPLEETLSLSAVEQVFANRGIAPQNLYHYLNTSAEDLIDPASIKNMEEGVKLLIKHISNNDKIFV